MACCNPTEVKASKTKVKDVQMTYYQDVVDYSVDVLGNVNTAYSDLISDTNYTAKNALFAIMVVLTDLVKLQEETSGVTKVAESTSTLNDVSTNAPVTKTSLDTEKTRLQGLLTQAGANIDALIALITAEEGQPTPDADLLRRYSIKLNILYSTSNKLKQQLLFYDLNDF